MANSIHTQFHSFDRVELPEEDYQGLLESLGSRLFPGYRWFDFKPRVRSPYGDAQPDAALISEDGSDWWVVEVELSRHGVQAHVDDQLRRLRDAWYGKQHFSYIAERYAGVDGLLAALRPSEAQFLVVVDDHSGLIERAARENDFDLLHILPFRSTAQEGPTLYATCVEGRNPLRKPRRAGGVPLTVAQTSPVVKLAVYRDDVLLPEGQCRLVVGTRLIRAWVERDRRGLVVALTGPELYTLLGEREFYWLATTPHEAMRLSPLDT